MTHRFLSWVTLPMVQMSHVEGRLRAMLDTKRDRRDVANWGIVVTLAAAAILVPLAALRPGPRLPHSVVAASPVGRSVPAATPKLKYDTLPADPRWTRSLGGGQTVELVGVTRDGAKAPVSWRPDGTQMAEPLYRRGFDGIVPQHPDKDRVREFALRLMYPPTTGVELAGDISSSSSTGVDSGPAYDDRGQITDERRHSPETGGFRVISSVLPRTLTRATVRVGVAGGSWRWEAACPLGGRSSRIATNRDGSEDEIIFGAVFSSGSRHVLTVSDTYLKQDHRVIAVGVNGQVYDLHDRQVMNGQKSRVTTVTFDVPLNQIKQFRFQTRPYRWVEFRDIPLQPRAASEARS